MTPVYVCIQFSGYGPEKRVPITMTGVILGYFRIIVLYFFAGNIVTDFLKRTIPMIKMKIKDDPFIDTSGNLANHSNQCSTQEE